MSCLLYTSSEEPLHIRLSAEGGAHRAEVEIRGAHTNIVSIRLDGERCV